MTLSNESRPVCAPCSVWRLRGRLHGEERIFELKSGESRVGRAEGSDVWLPFFGVSRHHARLEINGKQLVVVDLGSRNGTYVDNRRVERISLVPGDTIAFGPVELTVEDADDVDLGLVVDPALEIPPLETGADTTAYQAALAEPVTPCIPNLRRSRNGMQSGRLSSAGAELVFPDDYLPGTSPAKLALYRQMGAIAKSDLPVLLLGETGVGKERLTSIIHASSSRCRGPLVAINCTAIPAELLEAELFGICKRVATGVDPRPGKFQLADGGTILLDEIGEMIPQLQVKLLRVLQEKQIQPLGGASQTVDVRIVAATNADLDQRMDRGGFRRDLYYRLAGSTLEVPPLRECRGDIPALADHFLRRFAREENIRVRGVTVKALNLLVEHDWPGNVRELEHEIRYAVYQTSAGGTIDSAKLSARFKSTSRASAPAGPAASFSPSSFPDLGLEPRLQEIEGGLLREALRRARGRQVGAARLLGISRNGLAQKLRRFGIDYRDFRGGASR